MGAFLEQDGLLVIEAESYDESVTRNSQTWTESTTFTGFEGAGAMAALPDNGNLYTTGYGLASPYMNLLADFTNTGTFYVWVRVRAVSSGNTLHVGLNNTETPSAEALESNNFSDWELGLDLSTDRLLVLNTEESEDELYYGTAFVSGEASISGPTDQLIIDVQGSTGSGTVFNIPLNDSESFGDNSFIHFLIELILFLKVPSF